MRFIVPIILVLISITSFLMFTNPTYQDIQNLQTTSTQLNTALDNSKTLQASRDELAKKYQSISQDSLDRISKMLPDNVDNIRLIIDVQRMAQSYGMSITNIKFDSTQTTANNTANTPAQAAQAALDYGTFNLEFSTSATYDNFSKFLRDVESSLRLTDITSVDFASDVINKIPNSYTYTIKLKTYWLKA